jgi:hypothetical protein
MSLMNVVRIAKIVALLAFVLPWVAVSCQNVDVATASGIELIQGKMSENPDAGKQMAARMGLPPGAGNSDASSGFSQSESLGINFFGIAAAAVIVIGLALSFAGKGKTASRNVLVTSLLGLVLVFGTVWWWKEQVKGKAGNESGSGAGASSPFGDTGGGGNPFGNGAGNPFGGGGMDAMGAQMMDQMLQERFGYWICLTALIVAAGASGLGMAGGNVGATKPEGMPPAA